MLLENTVIVIWKEVNASYLPIAKNRFLNYLLL